ncbi:MAG: Maf family protein [Bacteroidetes bacterium]|nr:Maf family protein [Bacteroidota bacterium]
MHTVVSGVCISQGTRQYDITVSTKVYFDVLQETEIHYYLDKYQPYDKAGAYAIQEWIGINKITRIEGDYYNVVGFPMSKIFPVLSALLEQ